MEWAAKELAKDILLKVMGQLGGDLKAGDVQEVRCFSRVVRWLPDGTATEADPRHAELLAAILGGRGDALEHSRALCCRWDEGSRA